jgi:hypothetical protein
MDRKLHRTSPLKSESTPVPRSAFEMSLSLEHQDPEFQVDSSIQGKTAPQAGDLCPNCQSAKLDYDGMLNLTCPQCGYTLAGCFT